MESGHRGPDACWRVSPFQGLGYSGRVTQGVALGWIEDAPLGLQIMLRASAAVSGSAAAGLSSARAHTRRWSSGMRSECHPEPELSLTKPL